MTRRGLERYGLGSRRGAVGARTFYPTDLSGCVLWLRADLGVTDAGGGAVSAWADQSGTGNDVVQATGTKQPTLVGAYVNGQPAISFDGSADYLQKTGGTALGACTVFVVVRWGSLNQGAADYDYALHVGQDTASTNECYSISRYASADPNKYYSFDGGFSRLGPALTGQQWMIIEQLNDVGAPRHQMLLNGAAQTVADYGAAVTTNGVFTVGCYHHSGTGAANWLTGHIAEVVIHSRVLAAGERSTIRAYLGTRYGIAVV